MKPASVKGFSKDLVHFHSQLQSFLKFLHSAENFDIGCLNTHLQPLFDQENILDTFDNYEKFEKDWNFFKEFLLTQMEAPHEC